MSVKTYTQDNFDEMVLKSDKPVIVDFWAGWCPPCRALAPHIDELASKAQGKKHVGKVDVDANQELAGRYNVMTIPTVILFKDGEEVKRIVGPSPDDLENLLNN